MTKITKQKIQGFTQIGNQVLRDPRLSAKAKGLFAYMWSLPDNWDFYKREITKHFTDGINSIRTGIKELENYHYLEIQKGRDQKGDFKYRWLLKEYPKLPEVADISPGHENHVSVPAHEKRTSIKWTPINRTLQNTNSTNKHRQKTNSLEREQFQKNSQKNKKFIILKIEWKKIWGHKNERIINRLIKLSKITNIKLVKFAIEYSGSHCSAYNSSLSYVSKLIHDWKENEIKTIQQAKDYVKGKNKHHNYPKHRKSHRKIIGKLPYWAKPGYHYNPEKNQATPEEAKRAEKIMKKIRAKNL